MFKAVPVAEGARALILIGNNEAPPLHDAELAAAFLNTLHTARREGLSLEMNIETVETVSLLIHQRLLVDDAVSIVGALIACLARHVRLR